MIHRAIDALAGHAMRVAQIYEDEDRIPHQLAPRRLYVVAVMVLILGLMVLDGVAWTLRRR